MSRAERHRLQIHMHGALQGVGFRPHVFRLARSLGLNGWVRNDANGVAIEVEGALPALERFLLRVESDLPPHAFVQSIETSWLDPAGFESFDIRESSAAGARPGAIVLPDIATCPECLAEINDPANRRYRYPFTNCTHCGPRYSIVLGLPYDRPLTTMKAFTMCRACQAEYEDPGDRRFHAQPNACPDCGPRVELRDGDGTPCAGGDDALQQTARRIRDGDIVAIKGIGGYHLVVDARNADAVQRLRERKHREEKPLAVMFPSLEAVRAHCEVSELEARAVASPAAPIVLVRRRPDSGIAEGVAPGNPWLGAMIPYTPLHHLLLADLAFPVVATSGNLSDEPICIDEGDATERLGPIADAFLDHNRPIARHVDDSIVRVVAGRDQVLRRARGFAPLPVRLDRDVPPVLAVGGHLKNAVAVASGRDVFVSQHIGDLETEAAHNAFGEVIASLSGIYNIAPDVALCDVHPDYTSTRYAHRRFEHTVPVQHHVAHVMGCAAENGVAEPFLGVSWDGTGYGDDGTVWGGEFFVVEASEVTRVGHLRTFMLPGGEAAIREPRRAALGLLHEMLGEGFIESRMGASMASAAELSTFSAMVLKGLNSPRTSSAGRLFDAVAALLGLRRINAFEGQAAMELEFALAGGRSDEASPFGLIENEERPDAPAFVVDWEPAVRRLIAGRVNDDPTWLLATRFHNGLAQLIGEVAERVMMDRVVLSGGCFQNRYLTERTIETILAAGRTPYWHQRIPPNDGGIALGQIAAACHMGDI